MVFMLVQTKRTRVAARRGAIVPLFAIILPLTLLFAAMAVNLAYIQLTQTELDIATDASTRAASRTYAITGSLDLAHQAAVDVANLNYVAGDPLPIAKEDLVLGTATRSTIEDRYLFSPGGANANAVKINGKRNEESSLGPVPTFLPSLLGQSSMSISSQAVSSRVEVDIALVFDRSGSMAYASDEVAVYPPIPKAAPAGWDFGSPVPPNSRWLDAVAATEVFLNTINRSPQDEMVCLCTYADAGFADVPLTDNYNSILNGLDAYSAQMDGGGTNIADGIARGVELLGGEAGREYCAKVIIVLTDGRRTLGEEPAAKARAASSQGVTIYTVTFSNEADQGLMKKVARNGLGKHFHAVNQEDLIHVFETVANELPTLIVE
jgi:Flp pilus assembly protein TadG